MGQEVPQLVYTILMCKPVTCFQALRLMLERQPSFSDINVKPDPGEVTHTESLDVLIQLYAGCLHGE